MKPLAVDLRSRRVPRRAAWGFLLALWLVAFGAAAWAIVQHRDIVALDATLSSLRNQASEPVPVPPTAPIPIARYDASARVAFDQARAEWPALLTALESISIPGVTPVGIDVSAADRQMRVEVEFVDFASLLRLIDELNAGEPVRRWQLLQAQGAGKPQGGVSATGAAMATIRGAW